MASTTVAEPRASAERTSPPFADRPPGLSAPRGRLLASAGLALVFAIALAARLLARDVVITADEDNWMRRAGGFTYGLMTGQLGRTYQNGHPGVTTMWVATLTLGPERMIQYADRVHGLRLVGRVPGFWQALVDARVGFAVATALLVGLIAALTWRLVGPGPGLLAGVVVGLDPFSLAISQLVHMDALLSGCMVASVLAALVTWQGRGGRGWLALSGALAGLALLSKVPAVFLLAFVPALGLVLRWFGGSRASRSVVASARTLSLDLLIFGATFVVTVVALWPAIWVLGPVEVFGRVAEFARETGGQPHEQGTFFWGEPRADPGALFYPVALAFRLVPHTIVGLLLLAGFWQRLPRPHRSTALALLTYGLGFLLMMTLGAKKFDRYVLPIFPALGVLAGLGLALGAAGLGRRLGERSAWATPALGTLMLGLGAWPAAAAYPYFLSYYNPLLGGGTAAQRTVMVGNGEGLDQVARWLNDRPNAAELYVVSHSFDILQPLIAASGEPLRDRVPSNADYLVLYRFQMQIGHSARVVTEYLGREPEHVVRIGDVEYARIYRGPKQQRAAEVDDREPAA
ncbi:MAG: glycosyltransferase family 39 protein [Chloroflexota bacterium]|nr:glycosyltransferase family 39 protein [Chloroflexota bacterium]